MILPVGCLKCNEPAAQLTTLPSGIYQALELRLLGRQCFGGRDAGRDCAIYPICSTLSAGRLYVEPLFSDSTSLLLRLVLAAAKIGSLGRVDRSAARVSITG
jgi:hypothetical protein